MSNVQNNNVATVAKWAGTGAALAGTVGFVADGAKEYIRQRAILNKPDEFITRVAGDVAYKKNWCTEFFKGTKENAALEAKKLDKVLENAKKFVEKGKIDWKGVTKNGAKAVVPALFAGAAVAVAASAIYLVSKGVNNIVAQSKQPEQPVQQPIAEQV